jgi:purine-nucleoside phosphorylase
MSTVPEALVASHMNMRTLGISCITNMAAGVLNQRLSHQEVMETGERVKEDFTRLVHAIVRHWPV